MSNSANAILYPHLVWVRVTIGLVTTNTTHQLNGIHFFILVSFFTVKVLILWVKAQRLSTRIKEMLSKSKGNSINILFAKFHEIVSFYVKMCWNLRNLQQNYYWSFSNWCSAPSQKVSVLQVKRHNSACALALKYFIIFSSAVIAVEMYNVITISRNRKCVAEWRVSGGQTFSQAKCGNELEACWLFCQL